MKQVRYPGKFPAQWTVLPLLPEVAHHLKRVLRTPQGVPFILVDLNGVAAEVDWHRQSEGEVLRYIRLVERLPDPPFALHLIQGWPKGEKLDWILQKATELGVTDVHLLETQHSQVKYKAKQWGPKQARYQRILDTAALQCRRQNTPRLHEPATLFDWLARVPLAPEDLKLVAYEAEQQRGLHTVLQGFSERPQAVWLAIGPEGGWHAQEVALLEAQGFQRVQLGPRILRTETAAIAGLSALLYHWEWQ